MLDALGRLFFGQVAADDLLGQAGDPLLHGGLTVGRQQTLLIQPRRLLGREASPAVQVGKSLLVGSAVSRLPRAVKILPPARFGAGAEMGGHPA